MATSYTSNLKIRKPAVNDRTWNVPLNENADLLDAVAPIGALAVSLKEVPSASRDVRVAAGTFVKDDGTLVTYAGTSSFTCSASSTCKLYLTNAGTLTESTSSWPGSNHVRLATVVTGTTTITSVMDERITIASTSVATYLALAGGTLADGANVAVGSTTGTKFGTATTQKLGLWNTTPVVQPAHADQGTLAAQGQQALTDNSGGTPSTTLAAIGDTPTKDAVASLAARLAEVKTDVANVRTLLARLRTDLVAIGVIKGSA